MVVPVKNPSALAESLKQIREKDHITMGKNAAVFVKEKFDSRVLCEKILERKERLLGL